MELKFSSYCGYHRKKGYCGQHNECLHPHREGNKCDPKSRRMCSFRRKKALWWFQCMNYDSIDRECLYDFTPCNAFGTREKCKKLPNRDTFYRNTPEYLEELENSMKKCEYCGKNAQNHDINKCRAQYALMEQKGV